MNYFIAKSAPSSVAGEIIRHRIYYKFRQFETAGDLKEAIQYEWEQLDINAIRKLVDSVPKQCLQVIRESRSY